MEKKRKFRQDFVPITKDYIFYRGEVATIVNEDLPNVKIKINKKSYKLPYRDFIVITERID